MANTTEDVIRTLRAQAWERAKGELRAVAASFCGDASARPGQFGDYDNLMEIFISDVEARDLAE